MFINIFYAPGVLKSPGGGGTKHVESTGMCRPYGWVFGPQIL